MFIKTCTFYAKNIQINLWEKSKISDKTDVYVHIKPKPKIIKVHVISLISIIIQQFNDIVLT